jgi:hypothetical protein
MRLATTGALALAFTVVTGYAAPASAEMTLGEYKAVRKQSESAAEAWITAAENAYAWANAALKQNGAQPLYCAPDAFDMSPEALLGFFTRYVELNGVTDDVYLALIVLLALQERFPCQSPPD